MAGGFAGQRRAIIFGGAGLGVLVLLIVLKLALGGGGGTGSSDEELNAPPVTRGPRTATTATTATSAPAETFEEFTARNPFRPLVIASTGGTTGGGTGGGGGGGTGGGTTPTTGAGSGGAAEPGSGQTVTLLEINTVGGAKQAKVRVGSTVYTVRDGETFAGNYRVVRLGDRCGDFLFGDNPFSLCVGEQVVK
jgi:hypothetical protein